MFLQSFEYASDVADSARSRAGTVGNIVERLHCDVACVAVAHQGSEERREALLALAGAAAVAVVDLDVRDHALGQPCIDQAGSGAVSMSPAELQSSMVRTLRLPIACTMTLASASVLTRGVWSDDSGSMQ